MKITAGATGRYLSEANAVILMQSTGMFTHRICSSVWLEAVTQFFSCSYLMGWKKGVIWKAIHMYFQIIFEHGSMVLPTHWVWSQVPSATVVVEINHCSPTDVRGSDSLGTLAQASRAIKNSTHAFS